MECTKNNAEMGEKMKILVTGAAGQLGHDVMGCLTQREIPCTGASRSQFDITDEKQTMDFIKKERPDAVIHCAAYTAVDRAEEERELCRAVNVYGTRYIAAACREIGAKMLYVSTDYVFPGEGERFYNPEDATGPLGQYGRTKLEGEKQVMELLEQYFIVRISWVFGKNGTNFVKTMLRLGQERELVHVVGDQTGSPTYTADLAPLLCDMVMTDKYGIYHASNEGICTWAEFAEEIFRQAGFQTKVNAITTEEYPTKAERPKNSRLSKEKLIWEGFYRLPAWQDALGRYLKEF